MSQPTERRQMMLMMPPSQREGDADRPVGHIDAGLIRAGRTETDHRFGHIDAGPDWSSTASSLQPGTDRAG
jgi:hypothetical protein